MSDHWLTALGRYLSMELVELDVLLSFATDAPCRDLAAVFGRLTKVTAANSR